MTIEFGKLKPQGDWKEGWNNMPAPSRVLFNADEALVGIDFIERCAAHGQDTFCRICLPRLAKVITAAERVIDPEVSAIAEELPATDDVPPYIALVNPIQKNAFAMKLFQNRRIVARKPIYTTKHPSMTLPPLTIVKYVNSSKVCDCPHVRALSVLVEGDFTDEYRKSLGKAKLTFSIDGERVIDARPLGELLSQKETMFSRMKGDRCCLFEACGIGEKSALGEGPVANGEDFLGYMTPNGSTFRVDLEGVPSGGGLVYVQVSWGLPEYTTGGMSHPKSELRA